MNHFTIFMYFRSSSIYAFVGAGVAVAAGAAAAVAGAGADADERSSASSEPHAIATSINHRLEVLLELPIFILKQ